MSITCHFAVQEDDVIGILASDNIADLKPLGDRLLVEVTLLPISVLPTPATSARLESCCSQAFTHGQVEEGKDETDAGLLLTSSTKEQPTIGKVLLLGFILQALTSDALCIYVHPHLYK